MAEGTTALVGTGFLACIVITTLIIGIIAILKNNAESDKNGQRIN